MLRLILLVLYLIGGGLNPNGSPPTGNLSGNLDPNGSPPTGDTGGGWDPDG